MGHVRLVIDGAAAVGTVAVAVMAIWGERIRACLAPQKVTLRLHTFRGVAALLIGPGLNRPVRYYHLKVVNDRPWLTVQNCRVLLRSLHRRGAGDNYTELEFPVPFPFVWSGEQPSPEQVTITTERVLDFGALAEGDEAFRPLLRAAPNLFEGYVRRGEAVRYELVVEASTLASAKSQVFEVTWDGEYPIITEVPGLGA